MFCNNDQVIVIDLEKFQFPDEQQYPERGVNLGSPRYLMWRSRHVRDPNRPGTSVVNPTDPVVYNGLNRDMYPLRADA